MIRFADLRFSGPCLLWVNESFYCEIKTLVWDPLSCFYKSDCDIQHKTHGHRLIRGKQ